MLDQADFNYKAFLLINQTIYLKKIFFWACNAISQTRLSKPLTKKLKSAIQKILNCGKSLEKNDAL